MPKTEAPWEVTIEARDYEFVGMHHTSTETAYYVVCTCGFEKRMSSSYRHDTKRDLEAIKHRLDHIEGRVKWR